MNGVDKNTGFKTDFLDSVAPILRTTARDKFLVISSLAIPIILIVAGALTGKFALNSPLGHMVPITPHFSMSLPLLVTSSIGAASLIGMISVLAFHKKVHIAWAKAIGTFFYNNNKVSGLVRMILQPSGRDNITRQEYIERCQGPEGYDIHYKKTSDGVELGFFIQAQENRKAAPTVILFHGNAMVAQNMRVWGNYYHELGFNVCLMEYRGYGISDGETATVNAEQKALIDVETTLELLKEQGFCTDAKRILAHGYSLGGAYASMLAEKGCHVVLSHTFTSYSNVMSHMVPIFSGLSTDQIVKGSYGNLAEWDSLNRIKKMDKSAGLFVIQGAEDKLMPMSFGDAFISARYKDEKDKEKYLATIQGIM